MLLIKVNGDLYILLDCLIATQPLTDVMHIVADNFICVNLRFCANICTKKAERFCGE